MAVFETTHGRRRAFLWVAPILGLWACAGPPSPDPDLGTVWGYVSLAPTEGLPGAGGGYGDRRLANAKRVDYSQLKYAVVYAPTAPRDEAPLELRITDDAAGSACLEPAIGAASPETGLHITNASAAERIVSVPSEAWMKTLAPGETAALPSVAPGEVSVYLLGLPESSSSLVFVAAGVRAEAGASGRYTLRGLSPGRHEIRAWHPRMPPGRSVSVAVERGGVERVDLEIAVGSSAQ